MGNRNRSARPNQHVRFANFRNADGVALDSLYKMILGQDVALIECGKPISDEADVCPFDVPEMNC